MPRPGTPKCKKPSANADSAAIRDYSRQRFLGRRERQRSGVTGFFPVRNARVDAAIQSHIVVMTADQETRRAAGTLGIEKSAADIEHNARNAVARSLPPAPMVRSWRRRLTKQDTVEGYCKPNVRKALRVQA